MSKPTCILLGNEACGLSPEAQEAADASVYFPMRGFTESFNVAAAGSSLGSLVGGPTVVASYADCDWMASVGLVGDGLPRAFVGKSRAGWSGVVLGWDGVARNGIG